MPKEDRVQHIPVNLAGLLEDHRRVCKEHDLDWELPFLLHEGRGALLRLRERVKEPDRSDYGLVVEELVRRRRQWWMTVVLSFSVTLLFLCLGGGGGWFRVDHFSNLFLCGSPALILVAHAHRRLRALVLVEKLFVEYPSERALRIRQRKAGKPRRVLIADIYPTFKKRYKALGRLGVLWWSEHWQCSRLACGQAIRRGSEWMSCVAIGICLFLYRTASSEHELLRPLLGFVPLLWPMSLIWAHWWLEVRYLLTRPFVNTLEEMESFEQTAPNAGVPAWNNIARYSDRLDWFREWAAKCGLEPTYELAVRAERRRFWQPCALILLSVFIYFSADGWRAGLGIAVALALAMRQHHVSDCLHKVQLQFERFAYRNLTDIELLDEKGERVRY